MKVNQDNICDILTENEMEAVYRKKEKEYATTVAMNQVDKWIHEHQEITLFKECTCGDYAELATRYLNEHDCDIADNIQWQNLISKYFEEYNIIHPDLNP